MVHVRKQQQPREEMISPRRLRNQHLWPLSRTVGFSGAPSPENDKKDTTILNVPLKTFSELIFFCEFLYSDASRKLRRLGALRRFQLKSQVNNSYL